MSSAARPQICFGTVRHERLRPAENRFAYGVYFLRLPIRSLAQTDPAGRQAFAPWLSRNRFNLLSFRDSDYGDGRQSLLQWIERTLRDEGIADADGEIWLQTFPRVLGYVFNPVSFWFCHRADGTLRAVLCDVHNTFGEQHAYLLDVASGPGYGEELEARKVFHVSPFCQVEGRYRFRFMRSDAGAGAETRSGSTAERVVARIEYDDDAGPLLITSVSGSALPASGRLALKAFFTYPLMTIGVIARIHWQALRLWRKRVPFFSKPTPPSRELTR